jgi:hypothetical protein
MPIQITRLNPSDESYEIEADEMLAAAIAPTDLTNRTIIIDGGILDVNLRTLHDSIYPEVTGAESPQVNLTVYIEENVIVGSSTTATPAFDVGSWADDIPVVIYVRGRIEGAGGKGGDGAPAGGDAQDGFPGGTAFYTRKSVTLVLNSGAGEVWGGGGGGGGADDYYGAIHISSGYAPSGGGGGGQVPGSGGYSSYYPGDPGTTEAGGAGGVHGSGPSGWHGGDGGAPGVAGNPGTGSSNPGDGGGAGAAIDGIAYVTKTGTGDVRGGEV